MIKKAYLLIAIMAMLAMFSGCKDSTDPPEDSAFDILVEYMESNSMDLSDITNAWIIDASVVAANPDSYYIMDIRSQGDFDTLGHIEGAIHSSLSTIVTDAAASGSLPIVVTCYTGQSAGHAVVALRLSGYPDAKNLKFGMSAWNSVFDRWTSSTGNIADGHANWVTTATATPATFDYPEITSTATSGSAILAERVEAMVTGGFKGVNSSDVLGTPTNYFINIYWPETAVTQYGHIDGAYRINEDLTLENDGFMHLDPSQTIVTYCWTGQTSSVVTAYLTVLGYDATSLKFGVNSMIYDDLTSSKWSASGDYPYVVTTP